METKEKIGLEDLLTEITCAIQEYFVVETQADVNTVVLRFVNGQKFRLTVEEA